MRENTSLKFVFSTFLRHPEEYKRKKAAEETMGGRSLKA